MVMVMVGGWQRRAGQGRGTDGREGRKKSRAGQGRGESRVGEGQGREKGREG